MESAIPAAPNQNPLAGSPEPSADGAGFISRTTRHNTVFTVVAASVAPILYLVFIDRYATNSFYADDWSVAPLIHSALAGHLSLSQLWEQYNESRLFVGNIIDVLFGLTDRFDTRSVILFGAALFVASYALLLVLVRRYLGTRLTPIPVLVIGVTWFSLGDVQNSLWAFQVSWYLTVFFFVTMLFALQVPNGRRTLWFVVAVIAAFAASLSTLQGFVCWPLGAICLVWSQPWPRRATRELAAWIGAALVTLVLYLPGYDFNNNGCFPATHCSATYTLHHPQAAFEFFFAVIGSVIPGGIAFGGVTRVVHNVARFEAVGIVLFAAAVFIVVQSCRSRASRERFPLPLLLIGFGLLFDVIVMLGRGAGGAAGAADINRYVMANLILLTGIVIYAWAHIPPFRSPAVNDSWRIPLTRVALCAFALFLVVQVIAATGFGVTNGRATRQSLTDAARVVANQDRVPAHVFVCELYVYFYYQSTWSLSKFEEVRHDQLGEFRPSSSRYYRQLGPVSPTADCLKARGSS